MMNNFKNQTISALLHHIHITTYNVCKANKNLEGHLIFKKIWDYFQNIINNNIFYEVVRASNFGAYQLNINEYLLLQITHALQVNNVNFSPNLKGNSEIILSKIEANQPVLVIGLHNGFTDGMKLISEAVPSNKVFCTIGKELFISLATRKSNFKNKLDIINPDKFCYINLKKCIADEKLFFFAADYSNPEENLFSFIDPSIFKFAKTNQLPIIFQKSIIHDDGSNEVQFKACKDNSSVEDMCKSFLDFYCESKNFLRSLAIKKF